MDNNNCYNLYRDETSNVHVTEEIFTLLTINNYNVVETGGVIDFTLILGNHVDSYLYGLLSVTNGWYRVLHEEVRPVVYRERYSWMCSCIYR